MDEQKDPFTNITPREFELFIRGCLIEVGQGLKELDVQHDKKVSAHDGTYQIDVCNCHL